MCSAERLRSMRILKAGRDFFIIVAITLALLEAILWIFPELISLSLLHNFNVELRETVAAKRGLQTKRDRFLLDREDGGPPLWLFKPNVKVNRNYRDEDSVPTVTMDEMGFCNAEVSYSQSESFDIIAIGDSFTWCEGVNPEQTWPHILRQQLEASVYNLGMPGVGPYAYLQIFRKYGIQKSPRLVIFNIFEGNDLGNAVRHQRYVNMNHEAVMEKAGGLELLYNRIKESYPFRKSIALNLCLSLLRMGYGGLVEGEEISYYYTIRDGDERIPFNPENTDVEDVTYAQAIARGEFTAEILGDPLLRFKDLSEEFGFRPLVMYSPSAHTVYSDYTEFRDPEVGRALAANSQIVRGYLRAFCEQNKMPFLDLAEYLGERIEPVRADRLLYFRYNLHYTPLGHEEVARAVAQFLDAGIQHAGPGGRTGQ